MTEEIVSRADDFLAAFGFIALDLALRFIVSVWLRDGSDVEVVGAV